MAESNSSGASPNLSDELILSNEGMQSREAAFQGISDQNPADNEEVYESRAVVFDAIHAKIARGLGGLASSEFSPNKHKVLKRRWSITEAAKLVGRGVTSIRREEGAGKLPQPEKDPRNNRRVGYTLEQINHMRDHFDTRPYRADTDVPAVVSYQNFKGGCGKSSLLLHSAQYLAIKGYRVLVIDCDPQGTTSLFHGLSPGLIKYLGRDDSNRPQLFEYLMGTHDDFEQLIIDSYFPGIDIIPTSLELFNAEYTLAADLSVNGDVLSTLAEGVRSVWSDYDVVLLDPPPALGMLSMSAAVAANSFVIPMRPTMHDFSSTGDFFKMISHNIRLLEKANYRFQKGFTSIVLNAVQDSHVAEAEIINTLSGSFPREQIFGATMKLSTEIVSAGLQLNTVYDLEKPATTSKTHKRCINYLDRVNEEVETRIRQLWPSHRSDLRDEAII